MSHDLDNLLCRRYPAIFAKRGMPATKSAMYWGFACEDGWFHLIDGLCAKLQAATDAGETPQPVADQVKQKFGELRFYVSPNDVRARSMIDEAREQSAVTCEFCGAPGALRTQNGVQTVCELHAEPGSRVVTPEKPWPEPG